MFVQALMDLKKVVNFRAAAKNMNVVYSAIYDLNKAFASRITYNWGYSRLDKLRECFYTFQWVENHPGVIWNHDERKLTVEDGVWDQISKEKKLARCYINAHEPLWDELCELFDNDENETIWISDDEEDADDPFGANPDLYDSDADADSALPNLPKHDGGSSSKSSAPDKSPSEC
ncbi:UNVERIFIED_CONTAM: hypothetical protein Sindi_1678700 [Sesamum indicum]